MLGLIKRVFRYFFRDPAEFLYKYYACVVLPYVGGVRVHTYTSTSHDVTSDLPIRFFTSLIEEAFTHHNNVININMFFLYPDNRLQALSVSRTMLDNFSMREVLKQLAEGEYEDYEGSIMEHLFRNCALFTSKFSIVTRVLVGGAPTVKNTLCYQVKNIPDTDDGDCLMSCLEGITNTSLDRSVVRSSCGLGQGYIPVHKAPHVASQYGVTIGVYEDCFDVDIEFVECDDNPWHVKAKIRSAKPSLLSGDPNGIKILYYEEHYAIIVKSYRATSCYCPITGELVGVRKKLTDEQIHDYLWQRDLTDMDDNYSPTFYFFDTETTYAENGDITPYAWALAKYDSNGLLLHCSADMCHNRALSDALTQECALNHGRGKRYLIGFNNSRFDNYLLLNELCKQNVKPYLVRFAGNSILELNILGYTVKDLNRTVLTSLGKACTDFKTVVSKGELEHEVIQKHRFDGLLREYLRANHNRILGYVKNDVQATGELFFAVRKAIKAMLGVPLERESTLASMVYYAFKKATPLPRSLFPVIKDLTVELFCRSAVIGGRAQMFTPHTEVKNEPIVCLDMVSEYPHMMCSKQYPIGNYTPTNTYAQNKLGIYTCKIVDQPPFKIVPLRSKKGLNWSYDGEITCTLTNVEIDMITEYGGKVDIIQGYYWKKSSNTIFKDFLMKFINEKIRQDNLPENEKNPSLRQMSKLGPNGLSGKVIQRLFNLLTELITSNNDMNKFLNKLADKSTYTINPIEGSTLFVASGTKRIINIILPCVWGIYTYAYAREAMYRFITLFEKRYNMDTDSLFTSRACYESVKILYPEMFGDNLGQFKEELHKELNPGDEGPYGIFVDKKVYACYVIRNGAEVSIKTRFKGVNLDKDKIINDEKFVKLYAEGKLTKQQLFSVYYNGELSNVSLNHFRHLCTPGNTLHILSAQIHRHNTTLNRALVLNSEFILKKYENGSVTEI